MDFKHYIQESLAVDQIYTLYGLNFVLTAGDKFSIDKADLFKADAMYNTLINTVCGELIAESLVALASEGQYVWYKSRALPIGYQNRDTTTWPPDVQRDTMAFGIACQQIKAVQFKKWDKDTVIQSVESRFGSIEAFLDKCIYFFSPTNYVWTPAFGGKAWMKIAQEVKKFYSKRFSPTMATIDHMLDLVHNGGSWLNNFTHASQLERALNVKKFAKSPHLFKDKISDLFVRKLIGLSLVGHDKKNAVDAVVYYIIPTFRGDAHYEFIDDRVFIPPSLKHLKNAVVEVSLTIQLMENATQLEMSSTNHSFLPPVAAKWVFLPELMQTPDKVSFKFYSYCTLMRMGVFEQISPVTTTKEFSSKVPSPPTGKLSNIDTPEIQKMMRDMKAELISIIVDKGPTIIKKLPSILMASPSDFFGLDNSDIVSQGQYKVLTPGKVIILNTAKTELNAIDVAIEQMLLAFAI